jgi:predicted DNA-binding transcriptional regulator YafY
MFFIGGINVKESLLKSITYGQVLNVIYMSKSGEITKRRLKVLKVTGDAFQAYCFLRNTKRTFLIDNVLALIPVENKEKHVM